MRRAHFLVLLAFATGCPGEPHPGRAAGTAVASSTVASVASSSPASPEADGEPAGLVPLDAVDSLELSPELAKTIQEARARVPRKPTAEQRATLDELESRYERLEALALEESPDEPAMAKDRTAVTRVLASYYWERLRLFSPALEPQEAPEELVNAFLESGVRRE